MRASAADHLHSHTQGEQGSAPRSSMWPVLVLGILSAIIAWVWYRGSGDEKKAESPVQKPDQVVDPTLPPGGAQESEESKPLVASGESRLHAADPERCEQEVPCPEIQEKKVLNPEVYRPRCEQQPKLQVQELSDVEHLKSAFDVPSNAAATAVPLKVQEEAGGTDQLSDVPAKGELQGHIQEQELHGNIIGHLPDLQREEEAQANPQEHLPDLQREEEAQANPQEHLPDTSEKDEPVEHRTRVSGIQDSLLEECLEDVVHTNVEEPYKEFSAKNESHEEDMHPSDIPEVRELLSNGDELYPPLKKEVAEEKYPQDLDKAMVKANEGGSPTLMAEEPGAQILLDYSCHASKSKQEKGQGEECVHSISQEGVYANGGVDGAEHAAGCLLEHVNENAVNVLEAKKTQDLHLERIHTSSVDGNTTVADPFMTHEPVERGDLKRSYCSTEKASTALEDHADVCTSNESSQEGLLHFQNLGTGPETSSVDVFNFISKQEKNLSGLGSANTDEKTSFGCSEENIHEIDHQKARKVATIQPMPQNVDFAFRVHYITYSDSQFIAVTGDHEKLGKWESYVPLTSGTGGFWTHSITLPVDTALAWKFVMVENGKIKRWEECNNRFLKTAHEDIEAHLYWGYP